MGNDRCRWVRHRLPLLAGGELDVQERRRVERHLIGCPGCRDLRGASESALTALRSLAAESPARVDAPSLWPALARQIRESRHIPARPSFLDLAQARFAPGLWPALGLAMGLGGLMAASLPRVRDLPPAASPAPTAPPAPVVAVTPEPPAGPPFVPPADVPARPVASLTRAGANPFESPTAVRLNYDLDHGTPVGPGNRDPQHSY